MAELQKILICSDLDRTIIPNGYQEESAHCRPVFRKLVEHPNIYLTFLSGRDKKLILDAIEEYYLPMPDYAIGDVGTTLYRISSMGTGRPAMTVGQTLAAKIILQYSRRSWTLYHVCSISVDE